jgi:hypothetical protein
MLAPKLTAVECETMDAVITRVTSDSDGATIIQLDTGDGNDPWFSTDPTVYPVGMWPPTPGDRITVTVPRVIAATRG